VIARRALLTALAAAGLPAIGRAAPAERLFTSGPLATNRLARSFMAVPPGLAPDPRLLSAAGSRRWSDLKGKTHLVSLWAEWCAPCLVEAGDLARLAKAYERSDLGLVGILTASGKHLDLASAQALMAHMGAADLPLWIEPEGGDVLLKSAAAVNGAFSLPCNLLVDSHGVIRGRAIGAMKLVDARPPPGAAKDHVLSETDKKRLIEAREPTAWASPEARAFLDALAAGALSPSAAA